MQAKSSKDSKYGSLTDSEDDNLAKLLDGWDYDAFDKLMKLVQKNAEEHPASTA